MFVCGLQLIKKRSILLGELHDLADRYSHKGFGDLKLGMLPLVDSNDDTGNYAFRFEELSKAQGFSKEASLLEYIVKTEVGKFTAKRTERIEYNYEPITQN